jgi:hypothetical protein
MYSINDILSKMTVIGLSIYFIVVHNYTWWAIATIAVGTIVLLSIILELYEVWI